MGAVFVSVTCFVGVLSVMLIRDYRLGERWQAQLDGFNSNAGGNPGPLDILGWVLAVVGMTSFLIGLAVLAWVTSSLLP